MKFMITLVSTLKLSAAHDTNAANLSQHLQDKAVLNNSADKPALLITDNFPQRTHIDGSYLRGIDLAARPAGGSAGGNQGSSSRAGFHNSAGGSGGEEEFCGGCGDSGNGGRIIYTTEGGCDRWNPCGGTLDIQLKIDCDVNHRWQSTNDNISMRLEHQPYGGRPLPVCGVPGGQCNVDWLGYGGDFYLPQSGRHHFCVLPTDKLIIETDGTDAFIIDKLWIRGDMEFSIGGDNHAGMCLSRDPNDAAAMGNAAFGGQCCRGVKLDLAAQTLEYWGC